MDLALIGALVIQLIFESLPVSSSGHVFLFASCFPSPLYATWEGICALPTLCIIIIFFKKSYWPFICLLKWRLFRYGRLSTLCRTIILRLSLYSMISVGLAVISYIIMKGILNYTLARSFLPCGFFITMMILFSLKFVPLQKAYISLTWGRALIVGCAQAVALLPGISRLATTYGVCRWIGLSPRRSLEYSFLILMPLLCAAFLRDSVYLYRSGVELLGAFEMSAFVCATIIEWFFLQLTYRLALQHRLWLFGYYMVLPFLVSLLLGRYIFT